MEDAGERFRCSICLDLVFKPVVQPCGHIFCFWCAQQTMDNRRQSQCPTCRRPYRHFPRVCVQLHHFLMKAVPEQYRERANEIAALEQNRMIYSPHIPDSPRTIGSPRKMQPAQRLSSPSQEKVLFQECVGSTVKLDTADADLKHFETLEAAHEAHELALNEEIETGDESSGVTVEDFLCTCCNQLLYRPVVLNCGQAFCEFCVKKLGSSLLNCPSCGSAHPDTSLYVCLELQNYLENTFPVQYQERKEQTCRLTVSNADKMQQGSEDHSQPNEEIDDDDESKHYYNIVHHRVGCDGCGMFPIVGVRYKCRDCMEKVGFDLCGKCHRKSSSSSPSSSSSSSRCIDGRFNQQHGPDHQMEKVDINAGGLLHHPSGLPIVFDLQSNTLVQRRPQLQRHRMMADLDDYIDALVC